MFTHRLSARTRMLLAGLALMAGALPTAARAAAPVPAKAEDLTVPTYQEWGKLQFKVPDDGQVHSISVKMGDHVFEVGPSDDVGAFPDAPGYRMWETRKAGVTGNDKSFSYIVRAYEPDGKQRRAVESQSTYQFPGRNGAPAVSGKNPGRGLEQLDPKEIQAAMDRLAANPPKAKYMAMPGEFYLGDRLHPMHPLRDLLREIKRVTRAARLFPDRQYTFKFTFFNHDNQEMTNALIAAKQAGVKLEGMTDWTEAQRNKRPDLDLRRAGVPMYNLVVRNTGHRDSDKFFTNHTKFVVSYYSDRKTGKIVNGRVFDCSFNTEFHNWPRNQEEGVKYQPNRDVVLNYLHYFEAMKGGAPYYLTVNPDKARYFLTQPQYPLHVVQKSVDAAGEPVVHDRTFGSREAFAHFMDWAGKGDRVTGLDYVISDGSTAHDFVMAGERGADVHVYANGFWAGNSGDLKYIASRGNGIHPVYLNGGGGPVHSKTEVIEHPDGSQEASGGSYNPAGWSYPHSYTGPTNDYPEANSPGSHETKWFTRRAKGEKDTGGSSIADQILAQQNRLAHRYPVADWARGRPSKRVRPVEIEVRLPASLNLKLEDIEKVAFGGTPFANSHGHWMDLSPVKTRNGTTVWRGTEHLDEGVIYQGKPVIILKDGKQVVAMSHLAPDPKTGKLVAAQTELPKAYNNPAHVWSQWPVGETFFQVKPASAGTQRISVAFIPYAARKGSEIPRTQQFLDGLRAVGRVGQARVTAYHQASAAARR